MTRLPRLILLLLLVSMQAIAPWVHAHSRAETGGFLHLPGLEALGRASPGPSMADSWENPDLIVALQAGVRSTIAALPAPGHPDEPLLPPPVAPHPPTPPTVCQPYLQAPPPLFQAVFAVAHPPRAPPPHPSAP